MRTLPGWQHAPAACGRPGALSLQAGSSAHPPRARRRAHTLPGSLQQPLGACGRGLLGAGCSQQGQRRQQLLRLQAASSDAAAGFDPARPSTSGAVSSSSSSSPEAAGRGLWQRIVKPLRDFGFGRVSVWEGGVGLFVFGGIGFALVLISWARGGAFGSRGKGYQCVLEFPLACGISVGTPVRIRGVPVGSVLAVTPSLERVDVLAEEAGASNGRKAAQVKDANTVIPRNSLVEANQSGLIADPLIDITPQLPIPEYKASPLQPECEAEGKLVCHQGHISGQPGVAMDDLVYICTKLARNMDQQGLDKVFEAAEAAAAAIQESRPLLERAGDIANEVAPLLAALREGQLVGDLESLTKSAAEAAADISRLQHEVLTDENVGALRDSVKTLTQTLGHLEGVSGDLGVLTGDSAVRANVKQLVKALSRIVTE